MPAAPAIEQRLPLQQVATANQVASATALAEAPFHQRKRFYLERVIGYAKARARDFEMGGLLQVCPLCSKQLNVAHTDSRKHMQMCEEQAEIEALVGPSPIMPIRWLTPVARKGFMATKQIPLCRASAREWWGSELEMLEKRGLELLRQKQVKIGRHHHLPQKARLALVTYDGSGKYHEGTQVAPYVHLPEFPHQVGGRSKDDHRPYALTDEDTTLTTGVWWPVLVLVDEEEEEGLRAWTLVLVIGGVIWIVCIYQILWDQPVSWRVTARPLIPRARM